MLKWVTLSSLNPGGPGSGGQVLDSLRAWEKLLWLFRCRCSKLFVQKWHLIGGFWRPHRLHNFKGGTIWMMHYPQLFLHLKQWRSHRSFLHLSIWAWTISFTPTWNRLEGGMCLLLSLYFLIFPLWRGGDFLSPHVWLRPVGPTFSFPSSLWGWLEIYIFRQNLRPCFLVFLFLQFLFLGRPFFFLSVCWQNFLASL